MLLRRSFVVTQTLLAVFCSLVTFCETAHSQFEVLFNGKTLDGWAGVSSPGEAFWRVEDGAIVGETTEKNPVAANTFLVWQGGEIADFEFRCKVRFSGNNSGVQYRSYRLDEKPFALAGYQADLHSKQSNFGMLYSEKTGRGIIASRGEKCLIDSEGTKKVLGAFDADEELVDEQWNDLRIIAVGRRLVHQINGKTTVDVTDEHSKALKQGLLGLQLHRGPAMKVEYRSLLLRKLSDKEGAKLLLQVEKTAKPAAKTTATPAKIAEEDKGAWLNAKPKPSWIWSKQPKNNESLWFRKGFEVADKKIRSAQLYVTCDNVIELFVNGKSQLRSSSWEKADQRDLAKLLKPGNNVLGAACQNQGSEAGLLLKLRIRYADGTEQSIATDDSWEMSAKVDGKWNQVTSDAASWSNAVLRYPLGKGPWGIPGFSSGGGGGSSGNQLTALESRHIMTPPGFLVERIYSVPKEQGSWVSIATDPKGRIYACDQGGAGLYRLTLKQGQVANVEKVSQGALSGVSGAQGLLWAYDSLWVHRNGGNLMRLRDTDGDGNLDSVETIPSTRGGGEHGNHAVILTEDGKGIYMNSGNHSPMHEYASRRVPSWNEDLLLPRMWDARGHARGRLAPGGWITRLDPNSLEQTVHAIGFRNQYDITLNRFGDMFTYDADMEWDLGLPWYRPTRICQPVSGAEFGWRSGSGKWPSYYEDSLPPVVEIGPGSPTGVISARETNFPTRYRDAIIALDWTFGTIYAVHLKPDGAGYTGEAEHFVYSNPLPVTDAIIHEGDLVFTVGGRGTQSAMFRVRYMGHELTQSPATVDPASAAAREKRRTLEVFHGVENSDAVATAWPFLNHEDRYLRYAARIAIESQPVNSWSSLVYAEQDPRSRIVATLALARSGTEAHRKPAIKGLLELNAANLSDDDKLRLLRSYAVSFIRLGRPTEVERKAILAQLDPLLPSNSGDVNTELIRVLTYLNSPNVISKAMPLIANPQPPELPDWSELASRNSRYGGAVLAMLKNHPPTREIGYAFILRNMRTGWTLEQRRQYFEFLNQAAKYSGGASYPGYLSRIRDEALGNCSNEEREALADVTGENFNPTPDFPIHDPVGPGKAWELDEALAAAGAKPNFENGRSLYFSAKCANCHRLGGLGGNIGPDLTSVPNKFDRRYVVEAIVNPSKNISDQYGSSIVLLEDGRVLNGLAVEGEDTWTIYPMQPDAKEEVVEKDEVEAMRNSSVSQMPRELLNNLNAQEIADLVGYIMAAGDPKKFPK